MHRLVLLTCLLVGCDSVLFHPEVEEPCGVTVSATAYRAAETVHVRLATTCVEDAWNLGSWPTARLEGLAVSTTDGAPLQPGPLAYSPDPEGGVFRFEISPVAPELRYLQLAGRFVGLDGQGQEVAGESFDGQVLIADAPVVP